MTIYLIEGETGEYEDKFTWVSQAFTSKQLAQSTMDIWQQFAIDHFEDRYNDAIVALSPDPYFQIEYTGTTYRVIELELITDPFMESVLSTTKDNYDTSRT
jgi:hypothetical protein